MSFQIVNTDASDQALALYVILGREPLDFLEMTADASADVVFILHEMLTTPHPTSDMDLNKLGESLIDGIYRKHLAAKEATQPPEAQAHPTPYNGVA